ncbi:McrC family protein [Aliarcobacter cryaerophilus]|uniref:McrC family protein n=1 Tax=Aliarcobacter cryaerophilus TaxID=28198 RepID=UPI0021B1B755|nr:McrC family protein [Aliarcobacter cryaerophilus]MCT7505971.1 McrC family protein [Aliarcobacter cryaerophilus]MCT7527505.1 McrC family protein [Aliarcobacter cryaerophilus]MCT7541598.1 McrC family protein [Aliarcobacter cryaerophilus]
MKKEFILKEFEYLQYKDNTKDNFIKKETFDSLEKFVLENEKTAQYLKITTKNGFGKVLQTQNYVGVIQTKDGTTIEILPKIKNATTEKSKDILIKMLKTLKNSPFKNLSVANLKSSKIPLFEIFISMFLEELTVLVRNGIKSDYISKEENLKFLKGKLKISEQIKYNTIHKERFFVQYEEFISNRVENRLIKTTLQFLYNKSKLNKNQQRIREFLFVFDEIEISYNIKTDFSKIKLNRQMKDYEQVLLWCKTFLFENSFSPYKGNDIAFALLFDMNLLFESFVYSYLKKSSNFQDIKSQDRTHYLAYENGIGRFRLKPDIVINGGKIIADTKWKILSEDKAYNGVLQDDMYQLYAYGTKYDNCEKIYLIYPFDELIIKNSYNYFKNKELKLDILFFDVYKKEFVDKNIEL